MENAICSVRVTGQDYGAGSGCGFDGEDGAAVPVFEEHGAGGDDEGVESGVAVRGLDVRLARVGKEAVGVDCVGGV